LIGKVYIELDNVSSTNEYAKLLLAKSKPKEGTAIFAYNQWKGKGQYGNRWVSEPGENMILSVMLYPDMLALQRYFYLNIITSLSVRDMVADVLGTQVQVKWPNDIVWTAPEDEANNRLKLGGILIENTLQQDQIAASIVGMGVNVNQTNFGGATEGGSSIRLLTGRYQPLHQLVQQLFANLEERYQQLRNGQYHQLKQTYLANLMGCYQDRTYRDHRGQFRAKLLDVRDDGQVKLLTDQGLCCYHFKEVTLVG